MITIPASSNSGMSDMAKKVPTSPSPAFKAATCEASSGTKRKNSSSILGFRSPIVFVYDKTGKAAGLPFMKTTYGPQPTVGALLYSAVSSVPSCVEDGLQDVSRQDGMLRIVPAKSRDSQGANGSVNVTTTVRSSGVSTDSARSNGAREMRRHSNQP